MLTVADRGAEDSYYRFRLANTATATLTSNPEHDQVDATPRVRGQRTGYRSSPSCTPMQSSLSFDLRSDVTAPWSPGAPSAVWQPACKLALMTSVVQR